MLLELEENNIEANRLKIAMYRKVVAELAGEDITQVIVNSEKEVSIVR